MPRPLAAAVLVGLASLPGCVGAPEATPVRFRLDMVQHNTGEPRYESAYNDPAFLRGIGYTGKVFSLHDSPQLAIDWQTVDPEIFPEASEGRAWVDALAASLDDQYRQATNTGLDVFAVADLMVFPRALVDRNGMQETYRDPRHPKTVEYLRLEIQQMFSRFPDLDGLVVWIGEADLGGALHHVGGIRLPASPAETIVPLVELLRQEICVQLGKTVIVRTWLGFDVNADDYLEIGEAVEPHENLIFSVKHVEGDFHRGSPFSKILGLGRHPFIVEVQAAREYEGKGAYPSYVAGGVIEGFEEHLSTMPAGTIRSVREAWENSEQFAGVWTSSRGGGFEGPRITNELWCDVNAWVMVTWALDPHRTADQLLHEYAVTRLNLSRADSGRFAELLRVTSEAILRGRRSIPASLTRKNWTRDEYIAWPEPPPGVNGFPAAILTQRDEAVALWEQAVTLARQINAPDPATDAFILNSTEYGLQLHRIYRAVTNLAAREHGNDLKGLATWITEYDSAWTDFVQVGRRPGVASVYNKTEIRRIGYTQYAADAKVEKLRNALAAARRP